MAGRRRRTSNSTVATVDESHVRWLKESKVLKPWVSTQPGGGDEPCFVLNDAVIYLQDGKTLGNPLHTDFEGPFIVRGRLEVERDQYDRLAAPALKDAYIEIPKSSRYSIGFPPATLWVSGDAGWFEIVPSNAYRDMHNGVREAVTLYYSILMPYEKHAAAVEKMQKKKRPPPSPPTLDELFLKYAVTAGDGVFRDEVVERCHKWSRFLISHFPKETEFNWQRTEFAQWIISQNTDVKKKLDSMISGVMRPPAAAAPTISPPVVDSKLRTRASRDTSSSRSQSNHPEDVEMKDVPILPPAAKAQQLKTAAASTTARRGKSKDPLSRSTAAAASSPGSSFSEAPLPPPLLPEGGAHHPGLPSRSKKPVVDLLVDTLEEIAAEIGDMRKVTITSIQSTMWKLFKIRQYNFSKEVPLYFAKQLVQRLGAHWRGTSYFEYLKDEALKTPRPLVTTTLDEIPSRLVRRAPGRPSAHSTPPITAAAGGGSNAKGRNRTATPQDYDNRGGSDEHEDGPQGKRPRATVPGRKSGKAAGLRLSLSSKKRPPPELEDEAGNSSSGFSGRKTSKKARFGAADEEDGDEDMRDAHDDDDDNEDDEDEDEDEDIGLEDEAEAGAGAGAGADPDGLSVPPPKDTVRIVVHAEKIPSRSPTGPNGTWVCEQEGCGYVVRAAEGRAGQEEIERHFRGHVAEAEKISLAVAESRRYGHAPINHLLEKIQAMGKQAMDAERGSLHGELLPAPIKRRLLI